jgi:hypothetical protein
MTRKVFTVDEANALIPELERIFDRIRRSGEEMRRRYEQVQVLDALWGAKLQEPGNPDHEEFRGHREAMEGLAAEIERTVAEEIAGRGIRFPQGGLEHGLVDFPTTWQGRWVYLCWRSGEPRVGMWHEVDAGFAGRRPLTADQARLMGLERGAPPDDSVLDF